MQHKSLQSFAARMTEVLPQVMRGFLRMQSDDLARGKLSVPQFLVLDLLYLEGRLKMTRLAREIRVSLPAMSGLVDRLFKMGLVSRLFDESDRRIIKIGLTQKAKNIINNIHEQRENSIMRIFEKLEESEREEYLRILKKIRSILAEYHRRHK